MNWFKIPFAIIILTASTIAVAVHVLRPRDLSRILNAQVTPACTLVACRSTIHKNTVVGTTVGGLPVPAQAASTRKYVVITNSLENATSPNIKCRADGVAPVIGAGNPGDFMRKGDAYIYCGTQVPVCISDTAATNILSDECL